MNLDDIISIVKIILDVKEKIRIDGVSNGHRIPFNNLTPIIHDILLEIYNVFHEFRNTSKPIYIDEQYKKWAEGYESIEMDLQSYITVRYYGIIIEYNNLCRKKVNIIDHTKLLAKILYLIGPCQEGLCLCNVYLIFSFIILHGLTLIIDIEKIKKFYVNKSVSPKLPQLCEKAPEYVIQMIKTTNPFSSRHTGYCPDMNTLLLLLENLK